MAPKKGPGPFSQQRLQLLAWVLYDLANTMFSMNVISLYFALWVTVDHGAQDLVYSGVLACSMLLAGVAEPILGAASDVVGRKMPFLAGFTVASCLGTVLIGLTHSLWLGLAWFVIANFSYQVAGIFYNALMVRVATPAVFGRISGLGVGFGYLGAILGLVMVEPFVLRGGRQAAFVPTGALFFAFALPCLLFLREPPGGAGERPSFGALLRQACGRLRQSWEAARQTPELAWFLGASFLFLNAINTAIVFMSVFSMKVVGFQDQEMTTFYLVSTVFAILGSLLFGWITDRVGSRRTLRFVLASWLGVFLLVALAPNKPVFWIAGPWVGLSLGAVWVTTRVLVIELAPPHRLGEVFGLFGMAGKGSAILGPLVWGLTVWACEPLGVARYQVAVLVQTIFLLAGWSLLRHLRD